MSGAVFLIEKIKLSNFPLFLRNADWKIYRTTKKSINFKRHENEILAKRHELFVFFFKVFKVFKVFVAPSRNR